MFNEKIIKVACRVRVTYLKKLFKRLITMLEKKYKISFLWTKCGQKQWFCSHERSCKSLKNFFLENKNFFQLICTDMIFKMACGNFF